MREFYETQLTRADQSANFSEHLYEPIRADYIEYVEEAGQLEEFSNVHAYLQAFGVSGGASITTERNGAVYQEHFSINDDKSKFSSFAVFNDDGSRTEFRSYD